MRVVIAPDKFKGTMTARQAAEAIALGVRDAIPDAECVLIPMADGGDGTLDAMTSVGWERRESSSVDALGRFVAVPYATQGDDAVIEMAAVCGLAGLSLVERDPWVTTSAGLGLLARTLMRDHRVHLAIGGSASIDGGAGFLQGLGVRVLDDRGRDVGPGLRGVSTAHEIADAPDEIASFTVWSDVLNPLLGDRGAVALFGAQKGLTDPVAAEAVLTRWSELLQQWAGALVAGLPGAGAAGGVGACALALGAEISSGAFAIAERTGVDDQIRRADLVISGEGRLDAGTIEGKVPWVVAELAGARPVLLVAGSCPDPVTFEQRGYRVRAGSGQVLSESGLRELVAAALVEE